MIGLTDDVLEEIKKRQKEVKDDRPITSLYQSIITLKEYGLSPSQWSALSDIDKKILIYTRTMENYYIDLHPERIKQRKDAKQAKREQNMKDLKSKFPQCK